jgi:hypothetical protein
MLHTVGIIFFYEVKYSPDETLFKAKVVHLSKISILRNILISMVIHISEMW